MKGTMKVHLSTWVCPALPQGNRCRKWSAEHSFLVPLVAAIIMDMTVAQDTHQDVTYLNIPRPGPSLKEWRLNTNFDNVANWQGLVGNENCSNNIYEFPAWYTGDLVVTLPTKFVGKQIILPVNGHFVFPEGTTQFLTPETPEVNCRGREVKFLRTTRADWYNPDNWLQRDNVRVSADGESLWMQPTTTDKNIKEVENAQISAVPHIERVPCQYDSVRFPLNSTFNLKISTNVTIAGFYLGDRKQSYTNVAILMNSPLGKLQYQKKPEVMFSITTTAASSDQTEEAKSSKTTKAACGGNDEKIKDSDRCICANYGNREMKQKICSLMDCSTDWEDDCPNPITPHGFCCPVCGFHLKIRHSGNLRLGPLHTKLKNEATLANVQDKIHMYLGRYKEGAAHIVLIAGSRILPNSEHNDTGLLVKMGKLVVKIQSILNKEGEVTGVTLTESWGDLLPSGESSGIDGSASRLEGSGLGGGLISFIVILVLITILVGVALFIFIWNKKSGYPPLSLSSVTSSFPRMSSMRIPIVSSGGGSSGGGRRSSTISNSLQSFGFARFTNERASSVTLGRVETDTGEEGKTTGKSSSIRRTEQVDEVLPSAATEESNVTDANSGAFGFSTVSYDLVAGTASGKEAPAEEKPVEKGKSPIMPLLTIPEVIIVDMEEEQGGGASPKDTSSSPSIPPPAKTTVIEPTSALAGDKKDETGKAGKRSTPGFLASRIGSAYKKLDSEEDKEKDEKNKQEGSIASSVGRRLFKRSGQDTNYQNLNKEEENEKVVTVASEVTATEGTPISPTEGQEERTDAVSGVSVPTETSSVHVEEAKIIDF